MLVMMEKTLTLNKSSKVISFNEDRYARQQELPFGEQSVKIQINVDNIEVLSNYSHTVLAS